MTRRPASFALLALGVLALSVPERAEAPASQAAQYNAEVPKTIVELQQFRQTSSARVRAGSGRSGLATLVNLNPAINAWYLFSVAWDGGGNDTAWHLEDPRPGETRVFLDAKAPSGLVIAEGSARYSCDLLGTGATPGPLEQGRASPLIYYPLCEGRLYLRNPAHGARTALEAATDFLRNQVWGGEKVIDLFHHLLSDRYRETGETEGGNAGGGANPPEGPAPAQVDPGRAARPLKPAELGITLESRDAARTGMAPGAWYRAAGNPGVFVSVLQPDFISPAILASFPRLVNRLDGVEAASLCYAIAFDLGQFELGYALGTEHPEVNWSERVLPQMKDAHLPGPDGIGNIAPLVSTGLVSPENGRRTVATFTSGFKRAHGAFKYGPYALKNHGSHYGFIENGIVFSKLQPGLATVFALADGSPGMKTWTNEDNQLLGKIRYARQNGLPLAEFDPASRATMPGRMVTQWGAGNWSGSEDEKLRTIRAGAALQKSNGRTFLIYIVFSDATPSAMARVYQAYQCGYAMLLDMNALEHTYLALYQRSGNEMTVEHLLRGMSVLDKASPAGDVAPRFLGYPDNRDFFYVMRRTARGATP